MGDEEKKYENENLSEEQAKIQSDDEDCSLENSFDDLIKKCEKTTDLEKLVIKIKERITKKKDE